MKRALLKYFIYPKERLHNLALTLYRFSQPKLWNRFYSELLNKETNLTKSRLKTSLKANFLNI